MSYITLHYLNKQCTSACESLFIVVHINTIKIILCLGNNWKIISGKNEGQTQVVCSEFEDICNWSFPLDIHLVSTGVPGWPKIYIQVYHLDWFGRTHLYGYGFVSLPTSPGSHTLNCYTWRPFGTVRERFVQFFLGGGPRIKYPDLVFTSKDRYKLNTEAMGVVTFDVNVLLRNFDKFGVEYN
ncbi:b9 domain-containing [Holotrichia oblita]|uniref:B9 domain-containing n=1 Tax=Holotrichia oblita TaxID=644536 RepID=A0ACB9SX17_HOLOL|nr:b9 domain-containing [Holotrichia oblita]